MRLLCLTDPLTHPPHDTTVELYNRLAADPRFTVFHLDAHRVTEAPALPVIPVTEPMPYQEFRQLSQRPAETASFGDFDLAISRADLPWPTGYIETLARYEHQLRFVARPSAMRETARDFTRGLAGRFMPPGVVTRDPAIAAGFLREHGRAVVKADRSYGGKDIARVRADGAAWWYEKSGTAPTRHASLPALLDSIFHTAAGPFEFARYLDRVAEGDKRVVVIAGEIYGGYLRLAPPGGWINNQTSGGSLAPASVTDREREVVEATWRAYQARGLPMLGYDFLTGDDGTPLLSEVNATSNIGGLTALERLSGAAIYGRFLDWLLSYRQREGPARPDRSDTA